MHLPDKENAPLLLYLKTSFELNLPVSLYLAPEGKGLFSRLRLKFYGDTPFWEPLDNSEFTELDLALAAAYQFYLNNQCGRCGTPSWYGRSEHSGIEFELQTTTCYSCAAVDERQSEKGYKAGHGETLFAVPTGVKYDDDTVEPLPSPEEAMRRVK